MQSIKDSFKFKLHVHVSGNKRKPEDGKEEHISK